MSEIEQIVHTAIIEDPSLLNEFSGRKLRDATCTLIESVLKGDEAKISNATKNPTDLVAKLRVILGSQIDIQPN